MELDFAKAIRKHNKFKKVVPVTPLVALIQEKDGNIYLALGTEEQVIRYTKEGKWLSRMTFKTPLPKMDVDARTYIAIRLRRIYGKREAVPVFFKLNEVMNKWEKEILSKKSKIKLAKK